MIRRLSVLLLFIGLAVFWASGTVTARRQTAPGAPTIGTATAISRATVNFTAPASDGGSAITLYTATSSPGGLTATCKWSPCYVEGLSVGTSYTFTVRATNAIGQGSASAASNSVSMTAALIPPAFATTWTGAGVDIPTRTTVCSTLTAATYNNGADNATPGIQAALDACPDDQVVLLGAGVFRVDTQIEIRGHKLLRGSGVGVTTLQKRNAFIPPAAPGGGGTGTTNTSALVRFGPSDANPSYNSTAVNLTADGVKGATTVTVADGSVFAADQIVKIDQDDYTASTWGRYPPQTHATVYITLFTDELWIPIKCFENRDYVGPDYPTTNTPDGVNDCTVGTVPGTAKFPNLGTGGPWGTQVAGTLPVPSGLSNSSRQGRFTAEIKEIASVSGNVITFKTPLHANFSTAKTAQVIRWVGTSNVHIRWSGLEDLTLTGGSRGTVVFHNAAYSWMKNVDSFGYSSPIDLIHAYKVEIRDSILRDVNHPEPGGGGYLLAFDQGTSEVLIENNVLLFGEKSMVSRGSGAGSVVAYNYMDDAYIGSTPTFMEVHMNSSHGCCSHAVLFEGNLASNYDQDDTWGSSNYNVVLRNHITGKRTSFTDIGSVRAVGGSRGSYYQAIIGNVLGLAANAATWIYEDPADGTYGNTSSMWGLPPGKLGTIFRLGHGTGTVGATRRPEEKVRSTYVRDGNYDYVTGTQKFDRANGSFTIPNSLYLAGEPSWWDAGGGSTWPWVDPGGATKLYTLPAKVRADAMVAAATAPSAPVINFARMETSSSAMVAYYPPISNGGRTIERYTATSSPGGLTTTITPPASYAKAQKPFVIYVSGLLPNTSYTFTVTAGNSIGTSAASAASNAVSSVEDPPPTSAIVRVQAATPGSVGGTNTGSLTAVFANPVTVGNLIVVKARALSTGGLSSITDTQGNTYTLHQTATDGSYPRMWVYSAVASETSANTVTCAYTPAGQWQWCDALEYAPGAGASWSADGATRLHVSGQTTGTGVTDLVSTAINTSFGGLLVVGATQPQTPSHTFTAGTDFTLIHNITFSGTSFGGVEQYITTGPLTDYIAHITSTASGNYRMIWALFRTSAIGNTVPTAPTIGTATAGNQQATVTFTAPTSNGGQPITLYTATSTPGSFTGTATSVTPITVTGLSNGTAYTFTVTATNSIGNSPASAASNSVTPAAVVPGAPTIGTATAGNAQATVTFTAPASNGGATITGYTATSNPGGQTATGAGSPLTVTGLSNGNAYTFTVTATNSVGTGPPSAASNSVTPTAPNTVPSPPIIGTATAGNAQASVTFTPGATGGSAITGFTVTSAPGSLTGTGASSPIIVTGLTNGTPYSFTVTATNAIGTSNPSASSNQVTPATVPTAPTIGTASAGATTASVTFTPNADGGSPVSVFTATSAPGGFTGTGGASPLSVSGLSFGVSYNFTVTATNAIGTSSPSAASNNITLTASGDLRTLSADLYHLAPSGCFIRSGLGAPAPSLGDICDEYYQTDSPYTQWRKTAASTWAATTTGGGGATPYTQGDLMIANSTTTLGRVPAVTQGNVLRSNGVNQLPGWTNSPALTAIGSIGAGNLTLSPGGDLILGPAGNDILPSVGYTKNIGSLTNKFLTLHAAELWVETLVAQNTVATIGGRVLVGPTTSLTADLANDVLFINVKHNQIALGDTVYLEANGQVEFLRVTSAATGTGPYTYAVVRNLDGSGANAWVAGDAVFNTGTTGDGYIDLYSISAVNGPAVFGPTIAGRVRTSDTLYSAMAPRWAIGNLNGQYGYGSDIHGAAFGDPDNSYLAIDSVNGIRMVADDPSTGAKWTPFTITPDGSATFAGNLAVGMGGRNMIANSEFLRGRATGDRGGHFWGGVPDVVNPQDVAFACPSPCVSQFNPDGTTGLDNTTGLPVGAGTTFTSAPDDVRPVGGGSLFFGPLLIPEPGSFTRIWGPHIPVQHGQWYEFSYYVGVVRGDEAIASIIWLNAAGAYIGETTGTYGHQCTEAEGQGGRNLAGYCRAWAIAQAPTSTSEASQAHIGIPAFMQTYGVNTTPYQPFTFVTRAYFGMAQDGQRTPSPWGPAGLTLITGSMLSTNLVLTNTLRSNLATSLTNGTGFWLDAAASTPTFRVGNPVGNRLSWDGTNLNIGQGSLTVDANGIAILPGTTYADNRSYRFTVPTGDALSMQAFNADSGTFRDRSIITSAQTVTGSTALIRSGVSASFSTGTPSRQSSAIAIATHSLASVSLTTVHGVTPYVGQIDLGGIPNFLGATSGSAGSSAGYINVMIGGTAYRIQIFNP